MTKATSCDFLRLQFICSSIFGRNDCRSRQAISSGMLFSLNMSAYIHEVLLG